MIPSAPRAGAAPSPPTPVIMTEEDPAVRSRLLSYRISWRPASNPGYSGRVLPIRIRSASRECRICAWRLNLSLKNFKLEHFVQ
jgi:hypothetical protein